LLALQGTAERLVSAREAIVDQPAVELGCGCWGAAIPSCAGEMVDG
jgi:hypothetical protein